MIIYTPYDSNWCTLYLCQILQQLKIVLKHFSTTILLIIKLWLECYQSLMYPMKPNGIKEKICSFLLLLQANDYIFLAIDPIVIL